MISKMGGVRREWDYPVLVSGKKAVTDKEKAEMMGKAFVAIHNPVNLDGD